MTDKVPLTTTTGSTGSTGNTGNGKWPATALHVVALASLVNSFTLLFKPSPASDFMKNQFGGHWAFLTVLGLAVSTATFAIALLKDIFPHIKAFDLLKTALMVVIVPAEGIIAILYWGMTAYDPTLLVPPDAEFQISLFLDIGLHALPALFLWTDFLLFSPRMSKEVNPLLVSAMCLLGYTTWLEYAASVNKRFPYPFLATLSKPQRSIFYIGMLPVLLALFYTANKVHDIVRGTSTQETEADVVKKIE
ncbi:membrane protein [Meredithblackwellia eburnea MCA 4105]